MNKEIELSISKNYVSSWGFWEAMREILQNAIDENTLGHELNISIKDEMNSKKSIQIFNKNAYLPVESLVLGNSTKSDDDETIGKYGEGYKLALVVLLRLGYEVFIGVGRDLWVPTFSKSTTLNCEVLKIKVLKNVNKMAPNGTTFYIGGLSISDINILSTNCLQFGAINHKVPKKMIDTDYGKLLLDDNYKGKFYVEGLFIQDDNNFKYGYSFDSYQVDLDRDRRAINYYDLLQLTTNSLLSQTEDFTIVETAIVHKEKDVKELTDFYTEASNDFAVGYANYFMEKNNLDEDTFVGTEKEVKVSGSSKTFVTDSVQAKLVNKGLSRTDEYNHIKELARTKDNSELAWKEYSSSALKQLHDWIKINASRLSNKQINSYIKIIRANKLEPSYYNLIKNDVLDNLIESLKINNPRFKYKED